MSQQLIDLIDEDSLQILPKLPPQASMQPAPEREHNPVMPATTFNIPSLFKDDDDDDDDDHDASTTQPLSDHDNNSRRVSIDIMEDSDEELQELYKETKRLPRDVSKPPGTTPAKFLQSRTSNAPPTVKKTSAPPTKAKQSPPDSSAAEFLGDAIHAPTEVDPALLEEEGDYYINSSLYHGDAKPEAQPVNPVQVQQLLELNEKSSDATKEMDTPVEMKSLLMKHQRQALYWMVNRESEDNPPGHPRGGILADDQGFGKTVSMIALLLTNRPPSINGENPRWGNLIVTPTSVLNQWASELKEHIAPQFRPNVLIYHGPNKPKNPRALTMYDVVLTTYGTLATEYPKVLEKHKGLVLKRRKPGNLYKINWFRIVLDEGQAIRNFRRETFKAASTLNARRKWSLTGTPIQNTVNDIYSQFQFLGYHVTENYREWEVKYKRPLEGKHCVPAHFKRFQAILGVVLLRRAKHDKIDDKPVIDLPPRNMTILDLTFSRTEKQFYESQEERAVNRMHREAGMSNDFALALHIIMRLRQACGHPALCLWDSGEQFNFSDDELDVVELRMKTKCMYNLLPEQVRNRLFNELGPDKSVPQTCPVCFDVIEDGVVTKCGHLFCTSDYESWKAENNTCPTCRADLSGDDDVMSLDGVRKEIHAIVRKKKREEEALIAKTECQLQSDISKCEPIVLGSSQGKAEPILLDGPIKVQPISLGGSSSKAEPISLGFSAKPEPQEISALGKRAAESSSAEPSSKKQHVADDASEDADEDDDSSLDESIGDSERQVSKLKTSTKITRFMAEFEKIVEETDDKVLCFSQWTRMLDLVENSLKEQGHEYVRLDGSMSTTQREEQVRRFKSRSKCRLFLISLTAGSTGLNLSVANRVFLLDSWWNPAVENQAIDRVHRIGQKKPVEVIKLKIGGTIEERILTLQEKKRQIIDGALGVEGLKTMGRRRLTMRDLMGLFQDLATNVANRAEDRQNDEMATRAHEVYDMARHMGSASVARSLL